MTYLFDRMESCNRLGSNIHAMVKMLGSIYTTGLGSFICKLLIKMSVNMSHNYNNSNNNNNNK